MTSGRDVQIVLVALVLVLGAAFTLTVNRMFGGTVATAPPRAIVRAPAPRSDPPVTHRDKPKTSHHRRHAASRKRHKRSAATAPAASQPVAPSPAPKSSPAPKHKSGGTGGGSGGGGSFYNTG
jgi:hypothetical protein